MTFVLGDRRTEGQSQVRDELEEGGRLDHPLLLLWELDL